MLAELIVAAATGLAKPVVVQQGDKIGYISIPSLHDGEVIREGTSHVELDHGVGHLEGTLNPGQGGLDSYWGHRITPVNGRAHGPFYYINLLKPGQKLIVTWHGVRYTYAVTRHKIIESTDVDTFRPRTHELLTIAACAHEDGTPGGADWRYVVFARPASGKV